MRTVAATSATTRSGTLAYPLELAVDNRQWYSRQCQSKGRCASAPPHRRKDCTHKVIAQGGVDNMATGCGEVVVGGARALCAMSLCSILARMASRGAVKRVHSTQMCRIAALSGSGGSTGAITRSSSAPRCFLAVSFWRCLSLAYAGLGNNESANTATCAMANANSAARAADKEQCCSMASAVSPNITPRSTSFLATTLIGESRLRQHSRAIG